MRHVFEHGHREWFARLAIGRSLSLAALAGELACADKNNETFAKVKKGRAKG
jgi:hypothetical protein